VTQPVIRGHPTEQFTKERRGRSGRGAIVVGAGR
jgi:hypothetical protein